MKRIAGTFLIAVALSLTACTTTVAVRPPAPGLVLVEGRWVRPPRPGARWVAGHWQRRSFHKVWVAGHWRD
jgi:hypothetical protein